MLCIGHRGAMGHAPENTIASVQTALDLGADCIEIDVYCIEGHLIVFHDRRLERTTNGVGLIEAHTFAELRQLDAGDGEQIPTLAEVWRVINGRAGLNIELKGPSTAEPVATWVASQIGQGWEKDLFLVSSFDHLALAKVRQLNPKLLIGILVKDEVVNDIAIATELSAYSVHRAADRVDPKWIDAARRKGFQVFAYTVNQFEEINRLRQLGIDGVFTNFPERAINIREKPNKPGWPPKKSDNGKTQH